MHDRDTPCFNRNSLPTTPSFPYHYRAVTMRLQCHEYAHFTVKTHLTPTGLKGGVVVKIVKMDRIFLLWTLWRRCFYEFLCGDRPKSLYKDGSLFWGNAAGKWGYEAQKLWVETCDWHAYWLYYSLLIAYGIVSPKPLFRACTPSNSLAS